MFIDVVKRIPVVRRHEYRKRAHSLIAPTKSVSCLWCGLIRIGTIHVVILFYSD